jgi:hypothetical protein
VATGSTKTYICKEVFNSYGLTIPTNPNETFAVRLNKRQMMINVTPDGYYFSSLNILRTDYLNLHKVNLFVNYDYESYFTIKFNDKDTENSITQNNTKLIDYKNIWHKSYLLLNYK